MAISDIEILDESQRRRFDKLYAKAVVGELLVDDIVDDEFFAEVLDISPHDKNEGKTFLWWAAFHKNWQLVNRLINKNADVHTQSKSGINVLWLAVQAQNWDLAEELIDLGVNKYLEPRYGEHKGVSILSLIAANKKWNLIYKFVTNNKTIQQEANFDPLGKRILLLAAAEQNWQLVDELLNYDLDIHAKFESGSLSSGQNLLWLAAMDQKWDLFKNVIDRGADIHAIAEAGVNSGINVLWLAAHYNQWDLVRDLVAQGADVNSVAAQGECQGISFVSMAIANKQWDLVYRCIADNEDMRNQAELDPTGEKILWFALIYSKFDLATQLIKHDANVNFTLEDGVDAGKNILWLAAVMRQWNVVDDLIGKEADIHAIVRGGIDKGINLLWLAALDHQWDRVNTLILAKADIHAKAESGDNEGINILWLAAMGQQWKLIEYLIDQNVDPTSIAISSQDKTSFLRILVVNQKWDLLEKLIAKGVNLVEMAEKDLLLFKNFLHKMPMFVVDENSERWYRIFLAFIQGGQNLNSIDGSSRARSLVNLLHSKGKLADLQKCPPREYPLDLSEDQLLIFDESMLAMNDNLIPILRFFSLGPINYSAIPIQFPRANEVEVSVEKLNALYDGSRTTELQATFRDAAGALNIDIRDETNKQFFDEFEHLMDLFSALYISKYPNQEMQVIDGIDQNVFSRFKTLIRNAAYFNEDDPKFYNAMKRDLEEIYCLLSSDRIEDLTKDTALSELFSQLVVCGPGIYNSIAIVRQNLAVGSLIDILAAYRKNAVEFNAAVLANKPNVHPGYRVHVLVAMLQEAQLKGFNLPGVDEMLKHPDPFVETTVQQVGMGNIVRSIDQIKREYMNLDKLLEYITGALKNKLHEVWPDLNAVLSRAEYEKISEELNFLQDLFGIAEPKGSGNPSLISFDEEFNFVFLQRNLTYAIVKALIRAGVIEVEVNKLKAKDAKYEYIIFGDKVFMLEEKQGDFACYAGHEALQKIIPALAEQDQANQNVIRAALFDLYKTDATQFEKMLTQCRKSINNLSNPSEEMVLKVYASELAKIYNPKPMIFSTGTQDQDPEREPEAKQPSSADEEKGLSGGALYSKIRRNLKPPGRPKRDT